MNAGQCEKQPLRAIISLPNNSPLVSDVNSRVIRARGIRNKKKEGDERCSWMDTYTLVVNKEQVHELVERSL